MCNGNAVMGCIGNHKIIRNHFRIYLVYVHICILGAISIRKELRSKKELHIQSRIILLFLMLCKTDFSNRPCEDYIILMPR